MEQILIRSLPTGTKAALRARALRNGRSMDAEARILITGTLESEPLTLVDLLAADESVDIEFDPERLRLTARVPAL